jgi:hypothetical protein
MLIVIQYVDNNGIRYNLRELVDEFYAAVRDDGRIDLNFVGGLTWWLGVRYTYDLATGTISADQEAFIDTGVLRLIQTRHATSSQISEQRLVLLLSSSSSVLFFAVVFDSESMVASPKALSLRRLSLLCVKWLLAHQTRLVPSTLPVSFALYSCILELWGGI